MTIIRPFWRLLLMTGGLVLLTIWFWPGQARPFFQQGQEPVIEEGWAATSNAAASAAACPNASQVCVEWCQVIDGEPRPMQGTLCCVDVSLVGNDDFGDCLTRVN